MKALMNIHRSIVRAAEDATDWQYIGSFDEVDDEEYGSSVFLEPDYNFHDERTEIMILSLGPDDGDIELLKLSEIDDHEHDEFLKTLVGFYKDNGKPASNFREALTHRFPYAAGGSARAYEYMDMYLDNFENRDTRFPTDQEWDEITTECLSDAEKNDREFGD